MCVRVTGRQSPPLPPCHGMVLLPAAGIWPLAPANGCGGHFGLLERTQAPHILTIAAIDVSMCSHYGAQGPPYDARCSHYGVQEQYYIPIFLHFASQVSYDVAPFRNYDEQALQYDAWCSHYYMSYGGRILYVASCFHYVPQWSYHDHVTTCFWCPWLTFSCKGSYCAPSCFHHPLSRTAPPQINSTGDITTTPQGGRGP